MDELMLEQANHEEALVYAHMHAPESNLARAYFERRWISVDDRVPEAGDFSPMLLVLAEERFAGDDRIIVGNGNTVNKRRGEYSHWMPIPALPPIGG